MNEELQNKLELLSIELGELADIVLVMWYGMQDNEQCGHEQILSCMTSIKKELNRLEERMHDILYEAECN